MPLPHLAPFERTPIVFLTTCTRHRRAILATAAVHEILRELWRCSPDQAGWFVGRYVIMPDHVHLFASPAPEAWALAEWMRRWKGASARRINSAMSCVGSVWQGDYFDRYLRSREDYARKWDYVDRNPVRHGLAEDVEAWPYRGMVYDLRSPRQRD